MEINDLICAAAEKMGLKDTHVDTMRARQSEFRASIANSQRLLNAYIEKVSQLDDELSELKCKYESSKGGVKEIYARKIKIAFNKRGRLLEPVHAISDRIEQYELWCDKLDLLIFREEHPAEVAQIEDITLDLKIWLDEEKKIKEAGSVLSGTSYETDSSANVERMDVDSAPVRKSSVEDEEMAKMLAEI